MAHINQRLREQGLIVAWRDEQFALPDAQGEATLARIERAASRFWGTLTFGAHATGWVPGVDGKPAALWIAQRALDKATDPGLFDSLIGGGVPADQTPRQTVLREGWEEAGLQAGQMTALQFAGVLWLCRDIPEGLQHEALHSFDLALPASFKPHNQDGEVAGFELLPTGEALRLAAGDAMTVDAALVTLDFALRHRLLPSGESAALAQRCAVLRRPPDRPR